MPPELLDILRTIDSSPVHEAMRQWRWLYPAVNTAHILGIALILGSILPLDARMMGAFRTVPFNPLARVLIPTAVFGIFLATATGALLFTTDAVKYATTPLFQVKLGLIGLAIVNALVLRAARDWPPALGSNFTGTTRRLRWTGAISALLWLGALVSGRLLGYL
ncbi:MAG: hypothetical protein KDJ77_06600 [Rhodobiaceae bacterium]|nr:hypothetical protein [Rhodobiaceae bacterium]